MKRAIIVGSRGQDGRLLFEFLTQTGYHVVGLDRETTESNCDWDPAAIDILDATEVSAVIERFQPDEVYYLAAFHHSSEESSDGELDFYLRSHDAHVRGLIHFLDAMVRYKPDCRIFYAASSLIFGNPQSEIQDEQTPFNPTSIYGITKLSGLMVCRYYRATHQLFASVGILYNHESKYRGAGFLSKKTVLAAIEIQQGRREKLMLGDLDAVVDWGSAFDYIRAMQRILRHHRGDEFVIASGQRRTVRDFVDTTFQLLGLDWKRYVEEDAAILKRRKGILIGNASKLREATGWVPETSFTQMIREMIVAEGVKLG